MHCYRYPLLDGHYLEYLDCVHWLPPLQISLPGLLDLRKLIESSCFKSKYPVFEFRTYGWYHSLQMMITVASFEIASNISQDSYGLVFGINTFLALAFQVPSNFPFLNLSYKKAFIVCLETIQLSLSKLDFQKKLSLFVCKTDQR